ncbi:MULTISPECIES: SDR family oxidoreductase [unclassified Ruegeria]|uniref:SDR family oxidoreductase n=1 Tax=unclassified Ruegeria TaxID=2625375 RepID=UPI001488D237|nr:MULTISPECIES: SDR family oxidoreductase [unclassified Ruegeria]NOD75995.1 SDR family NAD(P)-dependent oxidoreductase [Ruegeria sp. HKCCD4332]NOD89954.1 SDR family NAD(P)-dependent oxidoreductase [Ruegeria sp. HKCCD4318]NOE15027.1 SDR family NAD(P)-dependent oxidoreductase [Ruegeria sp. HKCCD4318-2]NOG10762.1 SDR family oxidoreductase [Ruegeria sp. HKCCD4315]
MTQTLFSFGHGYSAQALSRHIAPKGWRIFGTTRDNEGMAAIRDSGAEPLVWPGQEPTLDGVTHLLISTAPNAEGDPVLAALGEEIARRAAQFTWVGYLSTTAVYGDHQGGWVDEDTPPAPTAKRGKWRMLAEQQWSSIPGLPVHIFRLAGIYGPGRGPFSKLKRGGLRRIIKPGQVFSRIHVEDIAQILDASMTNPNPGRVYNVCDDEPVPPQDVIGYAAELQGLPLPPAVSFEEADLTPMARSFYNENKRVRNSRIKDELGVRLIYPNYRVGLDALMKGQ